MGKFEHFIHSSTCDCHTFIFSIVHLDGKDFPWQSYVLGDIEILMLP